MADYMSDILGNLLYKEPRNESLGNLPSPEELKYKILVKVCSMKSSFFHVYTDIDHKLNVNVLHLFSNSVVELSITTCTCTCIYMCRLCTCTCTCSMSQLII